MINKFKYDDDDDKLNLAIKESFRGEKRVMIYDSLETDLLRFSRCSLVSFPLPISLLKSLITGYPNVWLCRCDAVHGVMCFNLIMIIMVIIIIITRTITVLLSIFQTYFIENIGLNNWVYLINYVQIKCRFLTRGVNRSTRGRAKNSRIRINKKSRRTSAGWSSVVKWKSIQIWCQGNNHYQEKIAIIWKCLYHR